MNTQPLTDADFEKAARELGCEPEVIKAIAEVETGWRPGKTGFLTVPASKYEPEHVAPIILFERHVFSRLTGRKYDKSHPHISHPAWIPGTYGASRTQHHRLQEAAKLDRDAALQSCSWGMFQMMGFNWELMGYTNLQDFISEMYSSNYAHLDSFIRYIRGRGGMQKALQDKNWDRIALLYNGAGYKKNAYHTKMAAAYRRYKGAK